jgi:hypothetical protein
VILTCLHTWDASEWDQSWERGLMGSGSGALASGFEAHWPRLKERPLRSVQCYQGGYADWANFRRMGKCLFSFGTFWKLRKKPKTFSADAFYLSFGTKWLGLHSGRFFSGSSGHPECYLYFTLICLAKNGDFANGHWPLSI